MSDNPRYFVLRPGKNLTPEIEEKLVQMMETIVAGMGEELRVYNQEEAPCPYCGDLIPYGAPYHEPTQCAENFRKQRDEARRERDEAVEAARRLGQIVKHALAILVDRAEVAETAEVVEWLREMGITAD